MKKNKRKWLLFIFVILIGSFSLIACEESAPKKSADKSDAEKTNVVTNTVEDPDLKQAPPKEIHLDLSEDDIVNLVESIDPYELKPTMTVEERYNLRNELYQSLTDGEIGKLSDTIINLSLLLTGTVADDLYKNLINTSDPKWETLEESNCYYASEKIENIKHLISNQLLIDDLNIVIKLCEDGVNEKDILQIVDAHRILSDIYRHLLLVPYTVPTEMDVDHGDIHKTYFKASKTLEGSHSLISN